MRPSAPEKNTPFIFIATYAPTKRPTAAMRSTRSRLVEIRYIPVARTGALIGTVVVLTVRKTVRSSPTSTLAS